MPLEKLWLSAVLKVVKTPKTRKSLPLKYSSNNPAVSFPEKCRWKQGSEHLATDFPVKH